MREETLLLEITASGIEHQERYPQTGIYWHNPSKFFSLKIFKKSTVK